MDHGKVYIAGAGPGNFGLVTVKVIELLKNCDVVIYDRLINTKLLNFTKKNCEKIYFGKENTEGGKIQEEINKNLVIKAKEGKNVLRLKGGDPFLFGRGGEEIEALIENNILFEVVSGVSSSIAVPSFAGIPPTHRDFSSELHIFTGHKKEDKLDFDFSVISKLKGTLVFLMGVENLDLIVKKLIENGKDKNTPTALVQNGTLGIQKKVIGDLSNIIELKQKNNIKPPSVFIVGEVVNFSEKFDFFSKKELFGLKILITRSEHQSFDFSTKLEEYGSYTLDVPFIDIIENKIDFTDLNKYSAIIFNSANAVRSFFNNIDDLRILSGKKIGVVGDATKKEIEKYKIKIDFIPDKYTVSNAIEKAVNHTKENDFILILTSNLSPVDTQYLNTSYKRNFTKIECYQTKKLKYSKEEIGNILSNDIDIITFLSSSTVESFFESTGTDFKEELKKIKFASIGTETTKTLQKFGYKAEIEAKTFTTEGLIEAILEWRKRSNYV
ncbi:MAG: uroporphyrinogen-III C-methyltransferase [Spirochaetes bacterium GWD1_27_9]|nr:MAG: uroporphyrinogen-III C-methyltransferase [Spirochaetes bacterium GWC1_27_15]OHD45110.1 MAG: uroporphyrinogen-III C-methyltransferase [Spirochaetes bacterium GWD1_27_9]